MYITKEELASFLKHQYKLYNSIPPHYNKLPDFFKNKIEYMFKDSKGKWHIKWNCNSNLLRPCVDCRTIIPMGIGVCPVCGDKFIEWRELYK